MRRAGLPASPAGRSGVGVGPTHRQRAISSTAHFARVEPDQLWVTDITEHPTREGKVYCCVVLDAYSRRVVGWSIDATPDRGAGHQRARHGHRQPPARRPARSSTPITGTQFTSWAFTRPRARTRAAAVDGSRRRLLRQRDRSSRSGAGCRSSCSTARRWTHPHRAGQRDLRVPGDLPQPAAPSQPLGMLTPIEYEARSSPVVA